MLVDLSPEELQERLRAGKVYPKERAAVALENFFRADKLAVLRELALREVAEDVEARRVRAGRSSHSARQAVGERVLALVEPQPKSQRIMRRAWRSAQTARHGDGRGLGQAARPASDRGGGDAARRPATARRHPRRALRRGRGRRSRRHGAARRRRARLDVHLRRHARRVAAPRDLRRLAPLPHGARVARSRHPRRCEPRRPGSAAE